VFAVILGGSDRAAQSPPAYQGASSVVCRAASISSASEILMPHRISNCGIWV
jgi:hypothetical protein